MTARDPLPDYIQLQASDPAYDAGFRAQLDRVVRAQQAGDVEGYRELMMHPWVRLAPYQPDAPTHCAHGHWHDAEILGPVNHNGRPHMQRKCRHCPDRWLEPVE